jgi:hypothetical protein
MVAQAVVIAVVPERGGKLGIGAKFVIPFFIEQSVQLSLRVLSGGMPGSIDGKN